MTSFGADAGVTVTNLETLARGKYTLAEVTGEGNAIAIPAGFFQRCELDSRKWALAVDKLDNPKALMLVPSPGFKISLR